MAEKYGIVPKRFTKEWWGYFWMYYKWYVIIPAVVAALITGAIITNIKMNKFDLTLTYAGPQYISATQQKEISKGLSMMCPDTNGDGEKRLTLASITMNLQSNDKEYLSSAVTMLQFALYNEEKYVYIIHKDFIPRFFGKNEASCGYAPVDRWLSTDAGDKEKLSVRDTDYAISLDNSNLLEKWGIDLTDHYLLMRFAPQKDANKYEIKNYESAKKFANILLKQ